MKVNIYICILAGLLMNLFSVNAQTLSATAKQNDNLRKEIADLQASLKATSDSVVSIKGLLQSNIDKYSSGSAKADTLRNIASKLDEAGKKLSHWLAHYEEPGTDQPVDKANKYLLDYRDRLLKVNKALHAGIKQAMKHVKL